MARSRNIKPGFFTNDELAELPALTRLLFIGLWTIADRDGRIEDRPKKIRAEVMPYDECDPDAMLRALHERGFIFRYVVGGMGCIQIVNWAKHQNPHVKEQASTMQAPDMSGAKPVQVPAEEKPCPEDAGLIPSLLIPDSSPEKTSPDAAAAAPSAKKARKPKTDVEAPTTETWNSYSLAYERRYGTEPLRNAKVNAILLKFVGLVPAGDAPEVAAFYVRHNQNLYINAKHVVELLVRDAERLYSDWRTGASGGASSAANETAYQRSMRERTEQHMPAIAAKRPGTAPILNPMDILDGLTAIAR